MRALLAASAALVLLLGVAQVAPAAAQQPVLVFCSPNGANAGWRPAGECGTPGTGISQPTGGYGLSGWLSGIYSSAAATAGATGTTADAAWSGSGNSTIIAALKAIWTKLGSPATQNAVSGINSASNTSSTSLISAVASNRIYVSAYSCVNTGATASLITFQDGSGGSALWYSIVPAGSGANMSGNTVLFKTTSGNAVYSAAASASATIYCSAAGYSGP